MAGNYHFPEDEKTSNIESRPGDTFFTVAPNTPATRDVFIGARMTWPGAEKSEAFGVIDANELRDAIDKAVGPREGEADWRSGDRVEIDYDGERVTVGRETVGEYVGRWVLPNGLHYDNLAIARRNPKAVPASTVKPYRPIDRDRLLRHIEDLEATLTRRNERHEKDQGRIRELEAEVAGLHDAIEGFEPTRKEKRQALIDEHGLQDIEIEFIEKEKEA